MTGLSVSNLSTVRKLTNLLQAQQSALSTLTEQLSSSKKHGDITDYDPNEARKLINLQATATQREAYVSVIATASSTLSIYDTTLTDMEKVASLAQSLANNNQTYGSDIALNVATQAKSYLKSVTVDINQSINGRYIFSGARYNTLPAMDLDTLSATTLTPTIYTDNLTLPSYDTEYVDGAFPPSSSVAAYTTDKATVNIGYVADYGITSNDPSIQKLVAGLRYLQAAGNSTDEATYKTNLAQGTTLLNQAMSALQTLHTSIANNINLMDSEKAAQKTALASLSGQVANIQQVDTTQVSVEITSLQTILQASYSATGSILKMSIINYL